MDIKSNRVFANTQRIYFCENNIKRICDLICRKLLVLNKLFSRKICLNTYCLIWSCHRKKILELFAEVLYKLYYNSQSIIRKYLKISCLIDISYINSKVLMRVFTTWYWPRIKKNIYYHVLKEIGIWIDVITQEINFSSFPIQIKIYSNEYV